MTKCTERGCRNLEWKCADCGRVAKTAEFASQFMQWISVKDQLPKDDQNVLFIHTSLHNLPNTGWYEEGMGFIPHGFHISMIAEATHWMPCPEAPDV